MLDPNRILTPAAIAQATTLTVADATNPTELNSLGTAAPDIRIVKEANAGSDGGTIYVLDTSSGSQTMPYVVTSATAGLKWIAIAGRYIATNFTSPGTISAALVSATQVDVTSTLNLDFATASYIPQLDGSKNVTTPASLSTAQSLTLNASSNGLTISKTTGTTLTVSSTNAAAISCSGGFSGVSATLSSLTSGRITYASTAGLLADSSSLTWSGTQLTVVGAILNTQASGQYLKCRRSDFAAFDFGVSDNETWRLQSQGAASQTLVIQNVTGGIATTKLSLTATAVTLGSSVTSGLTIAATTGTTLTVSSTDTSASVSLSGGQTIATSKNLRMGTAAIATNATDGFIYVSTCAGTPTGTPTTLTGTAPIVIDTTNHKLYFFSGGSWRDAGP